MWADIDTSHYGIWVFTKLDGNNYIWVVIIYIIYAMNQSFIKIEYDCLRLQRVIEIW